MATTTIIELNPATAFGESDNALIRKSGETKDRKISQSNFIKSIGNPAVKGFIATSDEVNKVTLNPSNGTIIDTYYDGMEISFISPINSTGLVQVRIGALAYKDIYVLNSAANVELTDTTYIQAIYSVANNRFYQTNAATTQVFTNEYIAEGVIAEDNSITTYTLTSAYGLDKTEYYVGMSIIFTADIASKGGVLVNIDELGNKTLTDKAGDKIANNLLENQVILAIYDGTNFIKNLFSDEVPDAPELPPEAIDPETGEIIPENVPEDNKLTVTVGNAGNTYTTITAALADLVDNFGQDGGNRIVTINLSNTYVWNERIFLSEKNYNWITINSMGVTNVTIPAMLQLSNSVINISGSYLQSTYYANTNERFYIYVSGKSNLIIKNANFTSPNTFKIEGGCTIEDTVFSNLPNKGYTPGYFINNAGELVMKNVTFNFDGTGNTSGDHDIYFGGFSNTLENVNVNANTDANYIFIVVGTKNVSNFTNCNFTGKKGINAGTSVALNMTNCNITRSITGTCARLETVNGTFTNCVFNSTSTSPGWAGIDCSGGSQITIDGGNYTYNGNTTNIYDIGSNGDGTIIRLRNNPIGGTNTSSNGVITNN